MLSDAGFRTIQIDTSEQVGLAASLPPYELRSYPAGSGSVFWYYDPKICSCVYEGHQDDFDGYQMLVRQQRDTRAYAAESEQQEVASLNALNGAMFPPPIFWVGAIGGIPGGLPSGGGHRPGGGSHRGGHGSGGGGHGCHRGGHGGHH